MPQFDFYTSFVQIFWITISFGVTYFFLNKTVLRTLAEVLKMRQKLLDYRIMLEKGMNNSVFNVTTLFSFKSFVNNFDNKN